MDLYEYDVKANEHVCTVAIVIAILAFFYFIGRDD